MNRALFVNRSGASAAEFALVLPLLLIMLFGVIDGGRFLWEVNRAEKATQVGARVAVVTDVLDGGLANHSYLGDTSGGAALTQGDVIPAAALGQLVCNDSGCTCASGACPTVSLPGDYATRFGRIVARMTQMKPDIAATNVTVAYRGSGLGYAGDPNGMDVAPLVTVELNGLQFRPLTGFMLATVDLPAFRTTLTAEDSSGTQSN
jgi:hypothetical protein